MEWGLSSSELGKIKFRAQLHEEWKHTSTVTIENEYTSDLVVGFFFTHTASLVLSSSGAQ